MTYQIDVTINQNGQPLVKPLLGPGRNDGPMVWSSKSAATEYCTWCAKTLGGKKTKYSVAASDLPATVVK